MQPKATLEWTLTGLCRHKCSYCAWDSLAVSYPKSDKLNFKTNIGLMSFEDFKIVIKKVPEYVWFDWSGFVEPSYHPQMVDFITHSYKIHKTQRLYSTLDGFDLSRLDELATVNFLNCAIHLPDQDGVMKIDITDEYVKKVETFISKINCNGICFGRLHPAFHRFRTLFRLNEQPLHQPSDLISRAGNVKSRNLVQLNPLPKKIGPIICTAVRDKLSLQYSLNPVDYKFNCFLCCCDFSRTMKLGNLLEQSYESLFESETYKKVIRESQEQDNNLICRNCELSASHQW